jgi:O-antigen/teichoic acid export membrane protein
MKATSKLRGFFTSGSSRSVLAKKNISVSLVAKMVSMAVSFIIVPITLGYVGEEEYGVWMIMSSLIHWVSYFDIGLGNGLRNKLAESNAINKRHLGRVYVSSVYLFVFLIALGLFTVFYTSSFFISWQGVFNTVAIEESILARSVLVVMCLFCVEFVLKILLSVLQALQLYAYADILGITAQIAGLLGIYIVSNTTEPSILYLCMVYAGKMPLVMALGTLVLYFKRLKDFRPSFKLIRFRIVKPVFNLGVNFFLNQILFLLFTQSSVFLIAQFFSPADVTIYNLAFRYMSIVSMFYMMVLTPFLSAFTEAYVKKDFDWIKRIMKMLNLLWIVFSAAILVCIVIYPYFFEIWVGPEIEIPLDLIIALGFFASLNIFYSKYSLFLNGIGVIRIQSMVLGAQAILFIPITLILHWLELGMKGIVLSQIVVTVFGTVAIYRQYDLVMNNKAVGIWLK